MPEGQVTESRALALLRALYRDDTYDVIEWLERRADKFRAKARKPSTPLPAAADLYARADAFLVVADFLRETRG
jgi:hypothetical protein